MAESRQEETSPHEVSGTEAGPVAGGDPLTERDARIAELEAQLRTVSAAYKEKQDEIGHTKDRLHRQALLQEEIRRGEVVSSLFEPVENLRRSLDAAAGHAAEPGLRMVYQQFMESLHRLGLEEVPGVGSRFDPSIHEAVATRAVSRPEQDGLVVEVFSTGFRIGTRLVRAARVVTGGYVRPPDEA